MILCKHALFSFFFILSISSASCEIDEIAHLQVAGDFLDVIGQSKVECLGNHDDWLVRRSNPEPASSQILTSSDCLPNSELPVIPHILLSFTGPSVECEYLLSIIRFCSDQLTIVHHAASRYVMCKTGIAGGRGKGRLLTDIIAVC